MTGARTWNDPGLPPVASEPDKACADANPEIFFPNPRGNQHTNTTHEAIRVCRRCPHTDACLAWALDTGQDYGIWGGTTAKERRKLTGRTSA